MKIKLFLPKLFTLLCIALLAFSCSNDDGQKTEEPTISADEITRINELVAVDLEAQFRIENPDTRITYTRRLIESSEVEKRDNTYYLITKTTSSITTSLLKVGENRQLLFAGVSCTSSVCTVGNQCTPVGANSCTPCRDGACTRTVSSDTNK